MDAITSHPLDRFDHEFAKLEPKKTKLKGVEAQQRQLVEKSEAELRQLSSQILLARTDIHKRKQSNFGWFVSKINNSCLAKIFTYFFASIKEEIIRQNELTTAIRCASSSRDRKFSIFEGRRNQNHSKIIGLKSQIAKITAKKLMTIDLLGRERLAALLKEEDLPVRYGRARSITLDQLNKPVTYGVDNSAHPFIAIKAINKKTGEIKHQVFYQNFPGAGSWSSNSEEIIASSGKKRYLIEHQHDSTLEIDRARYDALKGFIITGENQDWTLG